MEDMLVNRIRFVWLGSGFRTTYINIDTGKVFFVGTALRMRKVPSGREENQNQ